MQQCLSSKKKNILLCLKNVLCCFQYRRIGMLAAGTGIAPMLQVIQGILSNEQDETFIDLVYSSRTYDDILMKHTLDEMKAYWNFSVLYVVSKVSQINLNSNSKHTIKCKKIQTHTNDDDDDDDDDGLLPVLP